MVIYSPKVKIIGKKVKISALIQFEGRKPEEMYFITDKKYIDENSIDSSPFLAAILIPCMKLRELITIHGTVSEKLLMGTKKIMHLMRKWNMPYGTIKIKTSTIRDEEKGYHVGCFFSAGVDSFYTYLKHKNHAKNPLSHFILVHGFDIELQNKALFKRTRNHIQEIANQEKQELIVVETNIRSLIESTIEWDWSHGGALAAVALLLRSQFEKVFIAGAVKKDSLFPFGTHPDLDQLWSTEHMKLIHDGSERNRFEKIADVIASSDLALQHLRVCCQNLPRKYNCSACFKCLRTMIVLASVDALERAKTFNRKINLEYIRNMYYDYTLHYQRQGYVALHFLEKYDKHHKLQEAIRYSLEKSKHPSFIKKFANYIAYLDKTYNKRRVYSAIFALNQQNDRKLLFKILAQKGIIK